MEKEIGCMGTEVNLLDTYPNPKRNVDWRFNNLTDEQREVARQFGREFFDGDRLWGYGGYRYDGRWVSVVRKFWDYYKLRAEGSSVLDVGCAKGFMLYDFLMRMPGIRVAGLDISKYAVGSAIARVRPYLVIGNARDLPFASDSFELVVSINTVHNLEIEDCKHAIAEIQRVSRRHAFIVVDSFRNSEEENRMRKWNITGETILSVDEWKTVFEEVGYTGDYYWFIP